MKTHIEEISAGKGEDIGVTYEVSIDDEVVIEETEGDSLLPSFIVALKMLVAGGLVDDQETDLGYHIGAEDDKAFFNAGGDGTFEPVTSLSTISASTIEIGHNNYVTGPRLGSVRGAYVIGVTGGSADIINGFHTGAVRVSGNSTRIDGSLDGAEDVSNAYITELSDMAGANFRNEGFGEVLNAPTLHVGSSSDANDLDTVFLNDQIWHGNATGELDYLGQLRDPPVVDLTQQISTIVLTRDFTNDTGQSIPVREVGVIAEHRLNIGAALGFLPIARDVVNTSVPSSSTISINYRLRTSANSDSGILVQFNELLFRHLDRTSRTVQDINNANKSDSNRDSTFYSQTPGGSSWPRAKEEAGFPSERLGIQVGTSTQKVDEADFGLKTRISHGNATGELWYLGQHVEHLDEDTGNSKIFFDITRYFENRSPGSIDVEEAGLNVLGGNQSVDFNDDVHAIARARTGGISVATQEILKITYRISATVS